MLAAAVSMPPHARVNYRCHAVWNADRSDLRLVWDDAEYEHPFHAFNAQPHGTDRAASVSYTHLTLPTILLV